MAKKGITPLTVTGEHVLVIMLGWKAKQGIAINEDEDTIVIQQRDGTTAIIMKRAIMAVDFLPPMTSERPESEENREMAEPAEPQA